MKTRARWMTAFALVWIVYVPGCGDDDATPNPGQGGGRGGSAGAAGQNVRAGAAGALREAGGAGGIESGDAGSGGDALLEAGTSGAAGGPEAGGAGGAAGQAAHAGEESQAGGPQGGAAGAPGTPVDPRCEEIPVDATLTSTLKITADNECDVYVNGTPVGQTSNWGSAVTIDVSLYVHPGRQNVVAVVGRNTSSQTGNDRGIIGELTTVGDESPVSLIVTNDEWRVAQDVSGDDWAALEYDDSAWPFATEIATAGDSPWGQVLTNTDAKWIWFDEVPASTADKPNEEATYARRVFYFDFLGVPSNTPGCPAPEGED